MVSRKIGIIKMKIAYLIYNERPNSGLMKSQVLGLLYELAKSKDLQITLIAIWQPWVYWKYYKDIVKLKKELSISNINLVSIPLGLPGRYFFQYKYLLSINTYHIWAILKFFDLNKYDVVHGRGYFINYVAALLKEKYKLIFDLRSLFPEENIMIGNWKKEDAIYKKWKEIEKYTIEKAEHSVVVSLPMIDSLADVNDTKKLKYIPIGFDVNKFSIDTNKRDDIRNELGIQNKKVIVYAGSLQLNFWNDTRIYTEYFQNINSLVDDIHFLILTNSDHAQISTFLETNNITNYSILSVSPKEVPNYLSAADIGIQVMYKMDDSDTRFGVKVIEYWASGLPVITNSNVGGISTLVKNIDYLGLIADDKDDLKIMQDYLQRRDRGRIKKYAFENFEFSKLVLEYLKLYR